MADRKISDLTALTTPATGDLLPIVDVSEAAAADKNKSITVGELLRGAPDGTAAAPGIAFESDGGNGMFLGGTDILAFSTGGTQAVTIDASQRLGVGTSSPTQKLHVQAGYLLLNSSQGNGSGNARLLINQGSRQYTLYPWSGDSNSTVDLRLSTPGASNQVTITDAGNVGVGVTSPGSNVHVFSANPEVRLQSSGASTACEYSMLGRDASNVAHKVNLKTSGSALTFGTGGSSGNSYVPIERLRIDSSGRLLVGTSTARSDVVRTLNVEGAGDTGLTIVRNEANAAGAMLEFGKSRGTTVGSSTAVQDGDDIGMIRFRAADGTDMAEEVARITASIDGTPGSNDVPGRLVFSTTADGASSPTERMRIDNLGRVLIATTAYPTSTVSGTVFDGAAPGFMRTRRDVPGGNSVMEVLGNAGEFNVKGDGDCENTNNSYGGISDIKLKENIVDATSQWDDLKAIQVRKYNFKEETGYETHTQLGVVAQEIELVSPGLVSESPDRDDEGNDLGTVTKSVNYSVLYMKAVKALQEAMERIETLEAKVAALEAS